MKENANPFQALADIYEDGVKERDKAGYAEKFKQVAELFFESVHKNLDSPVHIEDIEYLDGYFIFGSGTNSVVHFHIKECPGWKFAIWWDIPDDSDKEHQYIKGTFFTQYEENLDKFKPSNSEISAEISYHFDSNESEFCNCRDAYKQIDFIRNEPYLAFCRDYWSWDYNEEFHSREEAEEKYNEFRTWKDNRLKYTKILDERLLDFVREKIMPMFNGAEIEDRGDSWSPRYALIAPYAGNEDIVEVPGCYTWFDEQDEVGQEVMKEFYSLQKECEKVSDEYRFGWYTPITDFVSFYKPREVNKE